MSQREISPLEDRLLTEAVANTDNELFRDAFDTPADGESDGDGDRSAEEMEDDLGAEADDSGEESETKADAGEKNDEDKGETDGEKEEETARDDKGRFTSEKPEKAEGKGDDKGHMVPRSRLTGEANKRREVEEREKANEDRYKTEIAAINRRFDEMMARLAQPQPQPQVQQQTPEKPAQKPDMFTDPEGYEAWVLQKAKSEAVSQAQDVYRQNFVESSMADAHEAHGEEFVKAYENLTGINPVTKQVMRQVSRDDPMTRAEVARIVNAPNPGRALMNWHKQQTTLQRVGSDPDKFAEQIRTETREALMKDPEFRKQLLADLKSEAAQADNGRPRNVTRFPKSLGDASGSQSAQRVNPADFDGSEEGIFESVWADRQAG